MVPNNDNKNRLAKTRIEACCKFKFAFSPYEFKKNPVTSNSTVVR